MHAVASAAAAAAATKIETALELVRVLILALTQQKTGPGLGAMQRAPSAGMWPQAQGWPPSPSLGMPSAWARAVAIQRMHSTNMLSRRNGRRSPWTTGLALYEVGRRPFLQHHRVHVGELLG